MLKIRTAQQVGLNIQSHLRDLLMSEVNMPIEQAQAIADKFTAMATNSDWLETSTGVTWEKTFTPSRLSEEQPEEPAPLMGNY